MGTIRRVRLHALLALVILCLCLLYSAANASDVQTDVVYSQLKTDRAYYEGFGYSFVNYIVGKLDDDAEDTWSFYLSRRTDYVVTGACDEDCPDLDLRLKNASGTVVDRDELSDYHPEVSVRPSSSQNYSVEVDMYQCNVEPCYYGIAVFER